MKMKTKKSVGAFALVILLGLSARAAYFNPATDWMPGKVGAFMHYWPTPEDPDRTRTFDVPGLVRQLQAADVDFFCLTLGQNSNHYCAPNDLYEELAGHAKGSRCSPRDVPAEIIAALKGTGIRFGLYSPCAPSNRDPEANRRFGYNVNPDKNDRNPFMTDEGVANWARACGVWAARYGAAVSLWWFDGAYARIGFTSRHAELLSKAVKAANPSMVVSFNIGVADWDPEIREWYDRKCAQDPTLAARVPFREWREGFSPWSNGKPLDNQAYLPEWADFTSGEIAQPFRFPIGQRWIEGNQAFMLTYLGDYWSKRNVRYDDGVWVPFLKDYLSRGGCICFDMGKDEATGLFEPAQVEQLGRLIRAAKAK